MGSINGHLENKDEKDRFMASTASNIRKQATSKDVREVVEIILNRILEIFEKKGYGTFVSSHECLGIITEEYHELVEAVRRENNDMILMELGDVAISAIFSIVSLRLNNQTGEVSPHGFIERTSSNK